MRERRGWQPRPPAECPPVELPAGALSARDYRTAISNGLASLQGSLDDFRSTWPGAKFSRTPEFRDNFALYADTSVCVGEFLITLRGPATWTDGQETKVDGLITDLLNTIRDGREGVSQRNTSAYRRWNGRVDARISAVGDAYGQLPGRPR